MDLANFKHTFHLHVRNYEIDWQGIVHNGNYTLYFELARIEYFKAIGIEVDQRSINGSIRIVIVRNEIDYFNSATFDDQLKIYSRVSAVKNSSIICEGVMINSETNLPIAKNVATLVWTDPTTGKSTPVPNEVRKLVDTYEAGNTEILWPTIDV